MAKRLHMTTADYLAIAIGPALIMALVGSLVFFLIEVLYVGDWVGRLNYAFGLFVFAAVLIGRISIEMGAERASLFAIALGVAMFLALIRFVEFPSPFSHLINLGLMCVVWWCAHKLTWDCTLIDDDEDSSGEGLMQRIGVDGPATTERSAPASSASHNELFESPAEKAVVELPWWRRIFRARKRRHIPGLWVLYFSLAALPLFGMGQSWIPVQDVGRRWYAFVLLLVYVAAALTLLVTTSFLGLRRYLRQRHIEMPNPIAGTWVATGALVIVLVMFVALLIPRPAAEVAISQVPWQASSPGGLSPSRYSIGNDGQLEQQGGAPMNNQPNDENSNAHAPGPNKSSDSSSNASGENGAQPNHGSQQNQSNKPTNEPGDRSEPSSQQANSNDRNQSSKSGPTNESKRGDASKSASSENKPAGRQDQNDSQKAGNQSANDSQDNRPARESQSGRQSIQHPPTSTRLHLPPAITTALGGASGILKLAFYALLTIVAAYLIWKHRRELAQAIADIIRGLRSFISRLFGGKPAFESDVQTDAQRAAARQPRFADFRNPFTSGDSRRLSPEELVRYTFMAFEAWANDRGCPRSPDRTPHELVRAAVAVDSPMYDDARRMVRLYSEAAYASRPVSRESANNLEQLWQTMSRNDI